MISHDIAQTSCTCSIRPYTLSDHDCVELKIRLEGVSSHGPGVWCLNTALLSDPKYVPDISTLIEQHKQFEQCFTSKREGWDFLKEAIKEKTIHFSSDRQKARNKQRVKLTNQLIAAKQTLVDGDESAKHRIKLIETELKTLGTQQLEGTKIRSRAQWLEDGEKPTRYFCNLEKSRATKNSIHSLINERDEEVTTQADLETTHTNFYQNLYSKDQTDKTLQDQLVGSLPSSLSAEEQMLCEGDLTTSELESALHSLKNKSPGPDGLPVEFYKSFWHHLESSLKDVLNESFHAQQLSPSMQQSVTRLIFKKGGQKRP